MFVTGSTWRMRNRQWIWFHLHSYFLVIGGYFDFVAFCASVRSSSRSFMVLVRVILFLCRGYLRENMLDMCEDRNSELRYLSSSSSLGFYCSWHPLTMFFYFTRVKIKVPLGLQQQQQKNVIHICNSFINVITF